MSWIDIGPVSALADGEFICVDVDGQEVLVYNIATEYFAIANHCSHDGGEIAGGDIIDGEIVCPRHGARFCLKTGAVRCPPAYEDISSYPVRIAEHRLWLGVDID